MQVRDPRGSAAVCSEPALVTHPPGQPGRIDPHVQKDYPFAMCSLQTSHCINLVADYELGDVCTTQLCGFVLPLYLCLDT